MTNRPAMKNVTIELLSHGSKNLDRLIALLQDAVSAGASIGFLDDLSRNDAAEYWSKVISDFATGSRIIWIAKNSADGSIVGSVQLGLERRRNGRHRAEVQKLMVLKAWRRNGIASKLMQAVEEAAQREKISLLFLDTSEGKGGARDFYETVGYSYAGGIPGYALDPDGTPTKNAIFYKQLLPISPLGM
jgi:ribosomal protein S18 acetylase RimI-like enzyme